MIFDVRTPRSKKIAVSSFCPAVIRFSVVSTELQYYTNAKEVGEVRVLVGKNRTNART